MYPKFITIFVREEIFERIRQSLISKTKEKLHSCTIKKEFRTPINHVYYMCVHVYIYTQNVFEEVKLTLKVLTCFHIEYNFAYKYIGYFIHL